MADLLSAAGELTGIGGSAASGGGFDSTTVITFMIVAIIFMVACAFGTWFFVRWWQFKYKIVVFQRINGQFQETTRIRARTIPVKAGGDIALLLSKPKKVLPMPSIQSGRNTFNYFISDDQEWINFSFADFDENRREVGSQFLDKEMRYARTSLQQVGDDRYNERGFWEKYGGMVAYTTLILVTCIGLWLIIDKMIEFHSASVTTAELLNQVLDKTNKILGNVDSIQSGGSGLKPAT